MAKTFMKITFVFAVVSRVCSREFFTPNTLAALDKFFSCCQISLINSPYFCILNCLAFAFDSNVCLNLLRLYCVCGGLTTGDTIIVLYI